MVSPIKIGTRESDLAIWQASQVLNGLDKQGIEAELVKERSQGDIDLKTPLYSMGVQGIFTRNLDTALLNNKIDLAVHSMKDVPTRLASGIQIAAVLPRGPFRDILVFREDGLFLQSDQTALIATGSPRRKAQWLNRYPNHKVQNLRGNLTTRLLKLKASTWDGAIFALAGLERINLLPSRFHSLDWMLPAPAQGTIVVICRQDDGPMLEICLALNDHESRGMAEIERDFLRTLFGGCSTPISALARVEKEKILFDGNILNPDGSEILEIHLESEYELPSQVGVQAAQELLKRGALSLLQKVNNHRNFVKGV